MSSSSVIRDETRLTNVAEKYRQLGYKVTISPPSKNLPRFLSKFRPDIVAEGPEESVVVEVTPSVKTRSAAYWKELSRVVQEHPRWRLELITDASKHRMHQPMNKELARKRLLEGQRLAEQGMLAASLLITWSAVEAAMRLAAKENEIDLPDQRPAVLISRLYTDGVLERQEYDFLVDAFGVRNAVAHGFDQKRTRRTLLKKLLQIGLRLLE
jgi:glycerol-3-phosphate cytidylyltransferase-like family protein